MTLIDRLSQFDSDIAELKTKTTDKVDAKYKADVLSRFKKLETDVAEIKEALGLMKPPANTSVTK